MTELTVNTISMAIRCVNMELTRVSDAVKKMGEDASPDSEEELMLLGLAAAELKSAYLQATAQADNMASYDELIRESTSSEEH